LIKSKSLRWAGHFALIVANFTQILIRKHAKEREREREKERLFGRFRQRLNDNIKNDVEEIGWENVESIQLAQYTDKWRADVNKRK
jgi:hypothetical protein